MRDEEINSMMEKWAAESKINFKKAAVERKRIDDKVISQSVRIDKNEKRIDKIVSDYKKEAPVKQAPIYQTPIYQTPICHSHTCYTPTCHSHTCQCPTCHTHTCQCPTCKANDLGNFIARLICVGVVMCLIVAFATA